ncbi:MAG: S8 family peptidase [Candidatus Diapherotrites archaeon]|nr:S8 family peptidase [Candidatus Diapherotrites archaeon]
MKRMLDASKGSVIVVVFILLLIVGVYAFAPCPVSPPVNEGDPLPIPCFEEGMCMGGCCCYDGYLLLERNTTEEQPSAITGMMVATAPLEGNAIEPHKVVSLVGFEGYDKNRDKVADSMQNGVYLEGATKELFTVAFDHKPTEEDKKLVRDMGGEVVYDFSLIYALTVRIQPTKITEYAAANPHVVIVSDPRVTRSLKIYRTAKVVRVRPLVWETYGYNGSGEVVTVMDSGVDDSHADLQGKIKNWMDCNPAGCTTIGQTLHDNVGHGTSIAGIIVGSGTQVGGSSGVATVNIMIHSRFTGEGGEVWGGYFSVDTDDNTHSIDGTLNWEAADGQDNYTIKVTNSTGLPNGVIGDETSDSDPLTLTTNSFTETSEIQYKFYVSAESGNAHNSTDEAYFAQMSTPIESVGDSYNLMRGLAPGSELVSVKVVPDDNDIAHLWTMNNAYDWIGSNSESDGVKVVSISLGGTTADPIESKVISNTIDKGVLPVAATGNDNGVIDYPARYPEVLAVGAIDSDGDVADYSNYGNSSEGSEKWPDVVAPGGSSWFTYEKYPVLTLDTNDAECVTNTGLTTCESFSEEYTNDSIYAYGTSMAVPHVSAIAALIAEAKGSWTYNSSTDPLWVKMVISMTAWETNETNRGSKDIYEGYGVVAADAAIEAVIFNHTLGDIESDTFGSGLTDKKVWAREVSPGDKEIDFTLVVPSGADYDLYLYNNTPDQYGQPQILDNSTTAATGGTESITYNFSASQEAYLVVKWVSGNGAFTLSSVEDKDKMSLIQGWNQFSFPKLPANKTVANVFSSISGSYDRIDDYIANNKSWRIYDVAAIGYSMTLSNIEGGRSYRIHMNQADTIEFSGTDVAPINISLYEGWNWLAWPGETEAIASALSSIDGSYNRIDELYAGEWEIYDSSIPDEYDQSLDYMKRGRGYVILMNSNDTLEVN